MHEIVELDLDTGVVNFLFSSTSDDSDARWRGKPSAKAGVVPSVFSEDLKMHT